MTTPDLRLPSDGPDLDPATLAESELIERLLREYYSGTASDSAALAPLRSASAPRTGASPAGTVSEDTPGAVSGAAGHMRLQPGSKTATASTGQRNHGGVKCGVSR